MITWIKSVFSNHLALLYFAPMGGTFIYLTFFDGYAYTWWNWIIVIPLNGFLSGIWPIYWGILRWLF